MSHVVVDEPLLARLRGMLEPVEVRDPSGHVLGHYMPTVSPEIREMYEKTKGLFDLEEAERILAAEKDKGRPLQEILRELEATNQKG